MIPGAVCAQTTVKKSDFVSTPTYDNLYPYMNNKMRVALNPGASPTQARSSSIAAVTRTGDISTAKRRVVARGMTNAARSAAAPTTGGAATTVRAGITTSSAALQGLGNAVPRRVVARSGARGDNSYVNRASAAAANAPQSTTESISSGRCLADYAACMNGYCERKNTPYNRCYCSSKLSQIDAEYQPAIDSLVKQIIVLRNGSNTYTQEEMDEYWESTVGRYTGGNSWADLDSALDINWADTESRVRGGQAFTTGHEYCVQHLRGCQYMASNLRDVYRSDIARDCSAYETALKKVKDVAESVVENYSE